MARVTKINVGGTNYDIAHEGELKNSGFEVVTALPTTGLFAGREVMYNGKKYVYSSGWKEEITANTMYEDKLLYNTGTIVPEGSIVDRLINSSNRANAYAYTKPNAISVQYSQDAGATWADYELSDLDKQNLCTFSKSIYCGGPGVTAGNVNYRLRVNLFPSINRTYIFYKLSLKFSYGTASNMWLTIRCLRKNQEDIDANYVTIVDKGNISGSTGLVFVNLGDINMINVYDKVVLDMGYDSIGAGKGLTLKSLSMYATYSSPENYLAAYGRMYHYDINKKSYFDGAVSSKELINFNVNNIEPTQTGSSVSKTSTWLWQYLVQAVNWLKANNVRLSAYNTKVAALEQADSDNNAYTQSVKTDLSAAIEELSNGLATVARSGSYNDLTDKPTFSGSYNDLTDKPTLFSGSYNDLTDKPTLATVATSGNYDDLLNKPDLVFSNIGGTISSVQIPDGLIANAKLANPSMSLNGTTVNLGDTAILPWYVDYNEVDYPARIRDHWLQIYRNGVWANLMYLGDILPTQVGQITSLDNLDWYNEQVSEYEVDSTTTTSILNGTTLPAAALLSCTAEQLTLNLYPISGKQYGKGSLDSLISDLQGKGFSVFVENDLDAILASGSDYLVRIKVSKVPTVKAIIECYVAR